MSKFAKSVEAESRFAESHERAQPVLQALAPEELAPVNLDIDSAVATVLGALPEIASHRDEMVRDVPGFAIENVDLLEDLARAASYANAQHAIATTPSDDLPELLEEGIAARQILRADASGLTAHARLEARSIEGVTGGTGPKHIAGDLQILCAAFRARWSEAEGNCGTRLEDLDRAEKVAARLLRVAGLREQAPETLAAAVEERARAFTAFTRAYDQVRRAIIFLRWDAGDADSIAPSLYAGRGGRGKAKAAAETATSTDAALPAAGVAPSTQVPAPAAAPVPVAATATTAGVADEVKYGPGGGSPFVA